jgi:hypothetical protein
MHAQPVPQVMQTACIPSLTRSFKSLDLTFPTKMDSRTVRQKRSDSVPHSGADGQERLPCPFLSRGRVFKAEWMDRDF